MCLRAVLKSFVRPVGETAGVLSDLKKRSLAGPECAVSFQRQIPLNYEKTSKEVGSWHF